MVTEGVGRLVVVDRKDPGKPTGILTRSDVLGAHGRRLERGAHKAPSRIPLRRILKKRRAA
jgi:hypothetical protein